jgi:hypothetical protein
MALLELIGGTNGFLNVVKNARDLRAGGGPAPSDTATFDTVFNLWGAILFETRSGCEQARFMVEQAVRSPPFVTFSPFSFQVIDSVLPEFFRAAPAPRMLLATTTLIARLRRIDHFQRLARPCERWEDLDYCYRAALGFAQDFVGKGGIDAFNDIVDTAVENARAHYGREPQEKMGSLFPARIDPRVPVEATDI